MYNNRKDKATNVGATVSYTYLVIFSLVLVKFKQISNILNCFSITFKFYHYNSIWEIVYTPINIINILKISLPCQHYSLFSGRLWRINSWHNLILTLTCEMYSQMGDSIFQRRHLLEKQYLVNFLVLIRTVWQNIKTDLFVNPLKNFFTYFLYFK